MTERRVDDTRLELAQLMTPNDANVLGKVFGGAVLALVDLAASATAQKYSGRVCVTAAFERVDFRQPIEIGELVNLKGHVGYAGRTSMEVTIEVFATHLPRNETRHTNTARVTMVAVDDMGKPVAVPKLVCETRNERVDFLLGRLRRELRSSRLAEIEAWAERLHNETDDDLDAWIRDGLPER